MTRQPIFIRFDMQYPEEVCYICFEFSPPRVKNCNYTACEIRKTYLNSLQQYDDVTQVSLTQHL